MPTRPTPSNSVRKHSIALALLSLTATAQAQQADAAATLGSIQVTGSWLGTGLQNSVKNFAGARTVVDREEISDTGATSIGDVLRRVPGVQTTDNSGTAGSAISLNVGVRGLTGRYSPRSTILLDGIPLAVAPYGQPQLSFAPISLANIESVDVVRGGGAVRYGPQNVGGIINFTTRAIPAKAGLTGDASVRLNHYGEGGNTAQYSTFLGTQLDSGLGLALLYSGMSGRGWREGSDERVNDLALKWRYELTPSSEVYGKVSYYDVRSGTPGGLTVAQYNANPFQNTRPSDYWSGERKGMDVGYVNTLSDNQEFEVRAYYNDSTRASALINTAGTQIANQPRDYEVLGIEPRYTHRLQLGATTHDVTVGYRYLRERGNDRAYNVARANYSTSYGPVQNLQLNSQTATNPLKPELAKTAELGARWTQGATSAELTVFKMKFDNQILQVPGVTPATFQNLGATDHEGIESAIDYAFDKASRLAGLAVYANFTYTRAIQKSGATAGNEVPFYSRITDTLGARYDLGAWRFNLATTHQTKQYSDAANTEDESASANVGRIPGFRLWNVQASWKVPNAKGTDVSLGINNLFDKRYYTRNVDGNAGRMVGAPRMFFVQGRYAF